MATYTILCPREGQETERFQIEADDDREAVALFFLRREHAGCQLWIGGREIPTMVSGQQDTGPIEDFRKTKRCA